MAENDHEEEKIEISLRPISFQEYIGQDHLKNNLKLAIDAVKKRKSTLKKNGFGIDDSTITLEQIIEGIG